MTPNSVNNTTQPNTSPPVTIILTIILLVFFFVVFFSIYFCRCFLENLIYAWYFRRNGAGTTVGPECTDIRPGLDSSIINSFPTFTYSSVKDLRKEIYRLECAICISEFLDDDIIRLLTTCCHVFHQECIDLWLELHKTCPVCRRDLDSQEKSLDDKSQVPPSYYNSSMHDINENETFENTFSITIKEDNDEDRGRQSEGGVVAAPSTSHSEQIADGQTKLEKFPRSHSTGHSIIVQSGEDRFTLRLPEHLHAKLIRGHNWTGSCTTFGEFKSKTSTGNGGFGEISELSGEDVKSV